MIFSPQAERPIGPPGTLEEALAALGALHHQDQAQLQLPPSNQVGLFSLIWQSCADFLIASKNNPCQIVRTLPLALPWGRTTWNKQIKRYKDRKGANCLFASLMFVCLTNYSLNLKKGESSMSVDFQADWSASKRP